MNNALLLVLSILAGLATLGLYFTLCGHDFPLVPPPMHGNLRDDALSPMRRGWLYAQRKGGRR